MFCESNRDDFYDHRANDVFHDSTQMSLYAGSLFKIAYCM